MRLTSYTWLWTSLSFQCLALLEERFVAFESSSGAVDITNAPILYSSDDFIGVGIAAESLANDYFEITGSKPEIRNTTTTSSFSSQNAIIVGSIQSSLIQRVAKNGTNSSFTVHELEGKWETFKTAIVSNPLPGIESALVIAGSDKRGAIFGIHTLAEQSGQSPWHWFADVPPTPHPSIYALPHPTLHGEPSIKYRGLFINDESPSTTLWWSRLHNATRHPLDTEYYRHVFDLMLRLKANYIWPAMWRSYTPPPGQVFFTDDPFNSQLADDMGIVVSTSHHEPMQRATNEWNVTEQGPWDWRRNKENVTRFMDEGIKRIGGKEVYITMGMRGPNDGPIVGVDALDILRDVFETERRIFRKYYGSESAVNQVWTLYKEVQTYYAAGLDPPEDVTLIFPDDNAGNVQRLPTGNESERAGGIGLYYHFEYVGSPISYKWQNIANLAKVYKELSQAKMRGADRIWIMNVGDIKPMELPLSFSMDLAWNTSSITFDTIPDYLKLWISREIGEEYADTLTPLLMEWMHLIGMRRYEAVFPSTYSSFNFREAERIMGRWKALQDTLNILNQQIPSELAPAFYELIYYPIVSGATFYRVQLGIALNKKYAHERRNSANAVADNVRELFESDYDLTHTFDTLLGGKWSGIMAQSKYDDFEGMEPYGSFRDWPNPARDMLSNLSYVQMRQDMQYTLGNMGIYAEESVTPAIQGRWAESIDASLPSHQLGNPEREWTPTLPVMDPYGPQQRFVELFMRGDYRVPLNWTIGEPDVDWVNISPKSGFLDQHRPDQRVNISISWDRVPEDFNATIEVPVTMTPSHYAYLDYIYIPAMNHRVPEGFVGFPETEGKYISIEAPHFQRSFPATPSDQNYTISTSNTSNSKSEVENVHFEIIPHLGTRTNSGSLALRPYTHARQPTSNATTASVSYSIYLFNSTSSLNATIYINGCLDTDPALPLMYSLTLDDAPSNFTRVLGQPKNAGDLPPEWMGNVMDNVWEKKVSFGEVEEGEHSLVWRTNSPEVYLEKVVVWMGGREGERGSYLGPPETGRVGMVG